jgi:hypothetical protein
MTNNRKSKDNFVFIRVFFTKIDTGPMVTPADLEFD